MAFSSNFTRITRGTDDDGQEVVFVEGTTDDTGDVLTAMYVNVADRRPAHIARNGTIALPSPRDLRTVPVENALGAVDWVATLSEGPLPDVDDWVRRVRPRRARRRRPGVPVGADAPGAARGGACRMSAFADEPELPELLRLAAAMVEVAGKSTDNFAVPAGYTYFGQFVDHDVTFDPGSSSAGRTPALDLDSLYGGKARYGHGDGPYRGARLRIARNANGVLELPRGADGRAEIGDGRNDENLILSQLHLLFIRFHNRVVDHVAAKRPGAPVAEVADRARDLVRRHYQWLVVNDLLPRIVGADTLRAVRAERPRTRSLPVEFTSAAYRFGHSTVREDYRINGGRNVPLFHPRGERPDRHRHLGGFRPLPAELVIEWKHFFRIDPGTAPQRSKLIDPWLARELGPGAARGPADRLAGPAAERAGRSRVRAAHGRAARRGADRRRAAEAAARARRRHPRDGAGPDAAVVLRAVRGGRARQRRPAPRPDRRPDRRPDAARPARCTTSGPTSPRTRNWSPSGVLRPQFASMADFVAYALGR